MADCWLNRAASQPIQNPMDQPSNMENKSPQQSNITCFICGKQGHKASVCPDWKRNDANDKPAGWKGKNMKKIFHLPATDDNTNSITRSVDFRPLPFLLDTGASISVIPEEHASKGKLGKGKVTLLDANGGCKQRELAHVKLTVGTKSFVQHVAVAPNCDLGGKGIFAVNLEDESAFVVLQEFRESTKQKPVNVVRTRSIASKEQEEEQSFQQLEHDRQWE